MGGQEIVSGSRAAQSRTPRVAAANSPIVRRRPGLARDPLIDSRIPVEAIQRKAEVCLRYTNPDCWNLLQSYKEAHP